MLPPDIHAAPIDTLVIALPASAHLILRSLAADAKRTPREHASILLQLAVIREEVTRRKLLEGEEREGAGR